MKVCVYAICKNEEKFAERWMRSMSEADGVYVLDTGSADSTPELLERLGAVVRRALVRPWRFDTARNLSLALVPEDADICVCTDLDEYFRPGWRAALEQAWTPGATQARYEYVWSFDAQGRDDVVFYYDKIHARRGYAWRGAVHEVPVCLNGAPVFVTAEGVRLEHHPDMTKSRSQYLPLLELAVSEEPQNDRNMHYLGREYMFARRWDDCIATLKRHLSLPTATWEDERAASMRYIAAALAAQGNGAERERWLLRCAAEAPWLREGWVELARYYYECGDSCACLAAAERALTITGRGRTYMSQGECWGALPHDLAAIASWNLGLYDRAVSHGEAALAAAPEDERLKSNLNFYRLGQNGG